MVLARGYDGCRISGVAMATSEGALRVVDLAGDERVKYTAEASKVIRTLALAALAVVWLFGGGLAVKEAAPQEIVDAVLSSAILRWASCAAVAGLIVDIVQYLWGAFAWGRVSGALNLALTSDDYEFAQVPRPIRTAWTRLDRWGFANNLVYYAEEGGGRRPPSDMNRLFGPPVDEARWFLAQTPTLPGMDRLLGRRWSPLWVNRTAVVLFWLKAGLVCAAYVLLLLYLLR